MNNLIQLLPLAFIMKYYLPNHFSVELAILKENTVSKFLSDFLMCALTWFNNYGRKRNKQWVCWHSPLTFNFTGTLNWSVKLLHCQQLIMCRYSDHALNMILSVSGRGWKTQHRVANLPWRWSINRITIHHIIQITLHLNRAERTCKETSHGLRSLAILNGCRRRASLRAPRHP